ncbi:MAG: hypothetical protein ACI9J2_002035 [Saprospiraceae bacterium]|jgi:hypothetical protein
MSIDSTRLSRIIETFVSDDALHCRWINTLSLMENVGAQKIVKSEHPLAVNESMLKHAAEETRHAYYLKRQIKKLQPGACPSFAPEYLVNARSSYQYLNLLDTRISRLLTEELGLQGRHLRQHAYVLVTYAIEVRADEVYGVYEGHLKSTNSPVSVRGIIAEEEQHLAEMEESISALFVDNSDTWCQKVIAEEQALHNDWLTGIESSLFATQAAA